LQQYATKSIEDQRMVELLIKICATMVNVGKDNLDGDIKFILKEFIVNTDVFALDLVTSFHTNSRVVRDLNAVAQRRNSQLKSLPREII
jgi:hypothetical protein